MKPKRTAYEIVWKILDHCKEPRRLTNIMQSCNLNTPTAKKYLDLLVLKQMLSMNGEHYKTTKEGLKYLELIKEAYLRLFH
ncbi:MAG: winged helix-turn-helix domain-containing protein [Candidatus Bathyarchaeota archaeon]|nr:winged helix-turn-helix domain-containing protein [Candidatus Bathyarchaeota archaeon]